MSSRADSVPMFLSKLWNLVHDPSLDHLISWGKDGTSFVVKNPHLFAQTCLPENFKHRNMPSFIRVLNMYGFKKVLNPHQGSLKCDSDELEFAHESFRRGRQDLLNLIKRKTATRAGNTVKVDPDQVKDLLNKVSQIKKEQEEQRALWIEDSHDYAQVKQELVDLRQKNRKQELVLQKLIRFLAALVSPQLGGNNNPVSNYMVQLLNQAGGQLAIDGASDKASSSLQQGPTVEDLYESEFGSHMPLPLPNQNSSQPLAITHMEENDPEITTVNVILPVNRNRQTNVTANDVINEINKAGITLSPNTVAPTAGQPNKSAAKAQSKDLNDTELRLTPHQQRISDSNFRKRFSSTQSIDEQLESLKNTMSGDNGNIHLDNDALTGLFSPDADDVRWNFRTSIGTPPDKGAAKAGSTEPESIDADFQLVNSPSLADDNDFLQVFNQLPDYPVTSTYSSFPDFKGIGDDPLTTPDVQFTSFTDKTPLSLASPMTSGGKGASKRDSSEQTNGSVTKKQRV